MPNDKGKLKQIETELKIKATELERREEELNNKIALLENSDLFLRLANLVDEIFITYEVTMGYGDGCKEMIINLIDAKMATQNAVWDR